MLEKKCTKIFFSSKQFSAQSKSIKYGVAFISSSVLFIMIIFHTNTIKTMSFLIKNSDESVDEKYATNLVSCKRSGVSATNAILG